MAQNEPAPPGFAPGAEGQQQPGGGQQAPDLKQWAGNEFSPAHDKIAYMPPGHKQGTVKHPFPAVDHDEYLNYIKEDGSIAKRTLTAPIANVRLDQLTGIQGSVNPERLAQHLENPRMYPAGTRATGHGGLIDRPVVVKKGGQMFIHDGHHRLTAQSLR